MSLRSLSRTKSRIIKDKLERFHHIQSPEDKAMDKEQDTSLIIINGQIPVHIFFKTLGKALKEMHRPSKVSRGIIAVSDHNQPLNLEEVSSMVRDLIHSRLHTCKIRSRVNIII